MWLQGSSAYRAYRPYCQAGASVDGASGYSVPHVIPGNLARKSQNFLAKTYGFLKEITKSSQNSPTCMNARQQLSGRITGFSLEDAFNEGYNRGRKESLTGISGIQADGGSLHASAMHAQHAHGASPMHPGNRAATGHASSSSSGSSSVASRILEGSGRGKKHPIAVATPVGTTYFETENGGPRPPMHGLTMHGDGNTGLIISNNPVFQEGSSVTQEGVATGGSGSCVDAHPLSNSVAGSAEQLQRPVRTLTYHYVTLDPTVDAKGASQRRRQTPARSYVNMIMQLLMLRNRAGGARGIVWVRQNRSK